jgi:hypothetical protein
VLAVQRQPEKYRAYIGTGQAVDLVTTDRIAYDDILAWARSTGRDDVARQLLDQGSPPYRSVYRYEPIMMYAPQAYDYDHTPNARGATGFNLDVAEYTVLQRVHTRTRFSTRSALTLTCSTSTSDATCRAWRYRCTSQGGHEMRSLAEPFRDWYQQPTHH